MAVPNNSARSTHNLSRRPLLRWIVAALMVASVALTAGCAGGGRSGTDQPGTDGTQSARPTSINDSSEQDLAAALRADDVSTPENWAQILVEYKPYPAGAEGAQKIQQVLQQFKADADTTSKITNSVVP